MTIYYHGCMNHLLVVDSEMQGHGNFVLYFLEIFGMSLYGLGTIYVSVF